jgi:hypothetical protein
MSTAQPWEVAVAQYGVEQLPGAKHWALIILTDPVKQVAKAFQVTGSTMTYEVRQRLLFYFVVVADV